jgi:hypothetical protein
MLFRAEGGGKFREVEARCGARVGEIQMGRAGVDGVGALVGLRAAFRNLGSRAPTPALWMRRYGRRGR